MSAARPSATPVNRSGATPMMVHTMLSIWIDSPMTSRPPNAVFQKA
jgi:hypothetical protein